MVSGGRRVGQGRFKFPDSRRNHGSIVELRPKRVIDRKSNCGCLVGLIPEQQVLLRAMKSFLMKMRSEKGKKKKIELFDN